MTPKTNLPLDLLQFIRIKMGTYAWKGLPHWIKQKGAPCLYGYQVIFYNPLETNIRRRLAQLNSSSTEPLT